MLDQTLALEASAQPPRSAPQPVNPPDERWLSENRTADGFRGDMIEAGAIPRDDCAAGMPLSPV